MNPEHPYAQAQFPAIRGDAAPANARDPDVFAAMSDDVRALAQLALGPAARPLIAAPDVRLELHLFQGDTTRVARLSAAECADPAALGRAVLNDLMSTAPAPLDADTGLRPRLRITLLTTSAGDDAVCALLDRTKLAIESLLRCDVCAPVE